MEPTAAHRRTDFIPPQGEEQKPTPLGINHAPYSERQDPALNLKQSAAEESRSRPIDDNSAHYEDFRCDEESLPQLLFEAQILTQMLKELRKQNEEPEPLKGTTSVQRVSKVEESPMPSYAQTNPLFTDFK